LEPARQKNRWLQTARSGPLLSKLRFHRLFAPQPGYGAAKSAKTGLAGVGFDETFGFRFQRLLPRRLLAAPHRTAPHRTAPQPGAGSRREMVV
jgi:hypothetical protein